MMNSNLPGLFLHSSHNPQRLRPESAHFHLTYRINHFPHCNPKSAHKLKCLQYDLRKTLAPHWLHVFATIVTQVHERVPGRAPLFLNIFLPCTSPVSISL